MSILFKIVIPKRGSIAGEPALTEVEGNLLFCRPEADSSPKKLARNDKTPRRHSPN
jgi:hypothetical protein